MLSVTLGSLLFGVYLELKYWEFNEFLSGKKQGWWDHYKGKPKKLNANTGGLSDQSMSINTWESD